MLSQETVMVDTKGGSQVARTKSRHPKATGDGPWFVSVRSPFPEWLWWHGDAVYTESQAKAVQEFLTGLPNEALRAIIIEKLSETVE